MARLPIPNIAYIHQDDPKYAAAFIALARGLANHSDQTNSDPTSSVPAAPQPVSQLSVISSGGIHDIKIVDPSPAYAGIQYMAEYSQTPDFQNAHPIDLGIAQNHRANLGPGKYYWRASSYYHPAARSQPVYHGGGTPLAVGDGDYAGPPMQDRQGFTGPYRNSATPPVRK